MRKRGAHTSGAPMPKAWEAVGRMGAEDPSSLLGGPHLLRGVVHERAIGGRAEDHLALHRLGERFLVAALDQRQDAAAETRAHDASAQAAFDAPRSLHQRVDVWGRHLEIVAEALM